MTLSHEQRRELNATERDTVDELAAADAPLTTNTVAIRLGMSERAALNALNRLRKRDMVTRTRSTLDARLFVYHLDDDFDGFAEETCVDG